MPGNFSMEDAWEWWKKSSTAHSSSNLIGKFLQNFVSFVNQPSQGCRAILMGAHYNFWVWLCWVLFGHGRKVTNGHKNIAIMDVVIIDDPDITRQGEKKPSTHPPVFLCSIHSFWWLPSLWLCFFLSVTLLASSLTWFDRSWRCSWFTLGCIRPRAGAAVAVSGEKWVVNRVIIRWQPRFYPHVSEEEQGEGQLG